MNEKPMINPSMKSTENKVSEDAFRHFKLEPKTVFKHVF